MNTAPIPIAANPQSGNPICDREGIEPWIVNASRELAMDAAHIPLIARIIKRHAPPCHEKTYHPLV